MINHRLEACRKMSQLLDAELENLLHKPGRRYDYALKYAATFYALRTETLSCIVDEMLETVTIEGLRACFRESPDAKEKFKEVEVLWHTIFPGKIEVVPKETKIPKKSLSFSRKNRSLSSFG